MQEQFFTVEAAARAKLVTYYANSLNGTVNQTRDFSVTRFSVGMKIKKWWGSSAGLMPFSTANYSFSGKKSIQGTNVFTYADYEGKGGVNQFYWDNGFKIGRHVSVGITTAYLMGSLTQTETLSGTDATDVLTTTKNVFLRNLHLDYGVQYYTKLNKRWDLTLGATYAAKTNLAAEYTTDVAAGETAVHNEVTKNDYFRLPGALGLGIVLTKDKQLTLAADYRYRNWSALQYSGGGYALQNSRRVSAGFEYSKLRQVWPLTIEKMFYQGGLFYSDSYLQVYGQQLKDMGISAGIGFSSKRSTMSYLIAFEYGIRGTKEKNLIQERYGKITLTLSYKDFWYTKGIKYY
ncbi:MAG TPA: hypothetical protein PLR74_01840 [Agriterribacter sp.]|nr:hypothetical protein [Agriterribacter sp.]